MRMGRISVTPPADRGNAASGLDNPGTSRLSLGRVGRLKGGRNIEADATGMNRGMSNPNTRTAG